MCCRDHKNPDFTHTTLIDTFETNRRFSIHSPAANPASALSLIHPELLLIYSFADEPNQTLVTLEHSRQSRHQINVFTPGFLESFRLAHGRVNFVLHDEEYLVIARNLFQRETNTGLLIKRMPPSSNL